MTIKIIIEEQILTIFAETQHNIEQHIDNKMINKANLIMAKSVFPE